MAAGEVFVRSSIASVMGAKVSVAGPGRAMYLIIGGGPSAEALVRAAGGEVVIRLNGVKMMATLPFPGYLSLRSSRQIAHIGPVSVDLKRLAQVSELLSKAAVARSNGAA